MADVKSFIKSLGKLLPPGKYAELAEKEAAETAAKASKEFKPGELVRSVSPPRVEGVNPQFKEARLETLKQIARENPTAENLRQLEEARKDLIGELESAPRAPQEQAAMDRLEEFVGSGEKKPEVLTPAQMRQKRELNKITQEIDAAKEASDKTPIMSGELAKKAAMIAALTSGGIAASSLMPEEAEAGFPGSVAARKKLLEKTEQIMDAWTSGAKSAGGGRELREQLAKQLDLDPTGAAKKEVLRRLAAKTEVRQNPVTGEHEFKVYRGDVKNRFSESPQSFTTNPDVAQEFADAYGGTVKETWLPASKVGSMPGAMKEGQYLSSEGEVIAKPFSAPASEYIEKPETLHQKITRRGQSSPEEVDDFINELMSEGSRGKKAAGIAAATGIGVGALGSSSAQASEGPTVSQSNPEFASASASKRSKEAYVPDFAKPIIKSALEGSAYKSRMEEKGKLPPDVGSYLYDTAYKYAIDPAKRKVMGALKGEEIPEDETPGYSDIYKQAMENVGKENVGKFLKGFASSAAEDPTGMTQEAVQSAKEEDVADAIANIAGTASEFAEDPLAPVTLGASRLARLPKTMRAISKFKTR